MDLGSGGVCPHMTMYLLTAEMAAEHWSSRPECSWFARCQGALLGPWPGPGLGLGQGQGLQLRRLQARQNLGLGLGLDKAESPAALTGVTGRGPGGITGTQRMEQRIVGD